MKDKYWKKTKNVHIHIPAILLLEAAGNILNQELKKRTNVLLYLTNVVITTSAEGLPC